MRLKLSGKGWQQILVGPQSPLSADFLQAAYDFCMFIYILISWNLSYALIHGELS
jgi:hypothetical protein